MFRSRTVQIVTFVFLWQCQLCFGQHVDQELTVRQFFGEKRTFTASLQNKSNKPITAALIRGKRHSKDHALKEDTFRYFDVYVNRNYDHPIEHEHSKDFLIFPAGVLKADEDAIANFEAAIFDGGSSIGNPESISLLKRRRVFLAQELDSMKIFLSKRLAQGNLTANSITRDCDTEMSRLRALTSSHSSKNDRFLVFAESARLMVPTWIVESLKNRRVVGSVCDEACVSKRLPIILKELDLWRSSLRP